MGGKRKDFASTTSVQGTEEGGKQKVKKKEKLAVDGLLPSTIKNKEKRSAVHAKLKHQKRLEKRKRAKAREAAEQRALELGEEVCLSSLFFFLN